MGKLCLVITSVSSQLEFFDLTDLESVVRNRLDLSHFWLEIDLGPKGIVQSQKLREINREIENKLFEDIRVIFEV